MDKVYSIVVFLLQNGLGFFLISNFTAFYVRTTIVSSPALILLPSQLCKFKKCRQPIEQQLIPVDFLGVPLDRSLLAGFPLEQLPDQEQIHHHFFHPLPRHHVLFLPRGQSACTNSSFCKVTPLRLGWQLLCFHCHFRVFKLHLLKNQVTTSLIIGLQSCFSLRPSSYYHSCFYSTSKVQSTGFTNLRFCWQLNYLSWFFW